MVNNWWTKMGGVWSEIRSEMVVDAGSSNTVILLKDKGVVLEEPTVMVRTKKKRWIGLSAPESKISATVAFGAKAKEMLDREPRRLEVVKPVRRGVVVEMEAMENLYARFLRMVYEIPSKIPKFLKPTVVVGVPSKVTEVQKRALASVLKQAGAGKVIALEKLAVIGIGLGVKPEKGTAVLVVDIGGGRSEAGLLSMGGVVVDGGVEVGGEDLDMAILNYVKMKHGLLIGRNTAERIKIEIGGVVEDKEENLKTTVVRGRDLETGLPKSIKMNAGEVREAITLEVGKIVKMIKQLLDEVPSELMGEVLNKGIVLVGNGSKLRGLEKLIVAETKVSAWVAPEPGLVMVRGGGEVLKDRAMMKFMRLVAEV